MLLIMEKERAFDQQFMTKTTDGPREALDVMVAKLRSRQTLKWKGKRITREAYINALWLWMEELGAEQVEKGIAPHLKRLEGMLGGDERRDDRFADAEPVKPEKTSRTRKKQA